MAAGPGLTGAAPRAASAAGGHRRVRETSAEGVTVLGLVTLTGFPALPSPVAAPGAGPPLQEVSDWAPHPAISTKSTVIPHTVVIPVEFLTSSRLARFLGACCCLF